jgi:hypothetical protein
MAVLTTSALDDAYEMPEELLERIRADYDEMSGLCLTVSEASRLWDLDSDMCRQVLEALIKRGVLRQRRDGFISARADRCHG